MFSEDQIRVQTTASDVLDAARGAFAALTGSVAVEAAIAEVARDRLTGGLDAG